MLLYKGSSLDSFVQRRRVRLREAEYFAQVCASLADVKEGPDPGASCSLSCAASSLLKDLHEALKYWAHDFQG